MEVKMEWTLEPESGLGLLSQFRLGGVLTVAFLLYLSCYSVVSYWLAFSLFEPEPWSLIRILLLMCRSAVE
jgi:hypothetical protein